jgi:hypothetical protein
MALQIIGASGTIQDVEAATKAARSTLRPIDYGALGSYKKAGVSGLMAAGLAGAAPIFSFRGLAANLILVRRVRFGAGSVTGFAAGIALFNMFVARAFTVNDTGGGALVLTTNNAKLRTSMATSLVQDFRISSTATLTAGTRTKDADPVGSIATSVTATAGAPVVAPTDLFNQPASNHPLVLAPNEGFVIEATVPATGTWTFAAEVEWDEIAAY